MPKKPLDLWRACLGFLPADLTLVAQESGALTRRRKTDSGEQLLRLCLLYAHCNSFKVAAGLAKSSGLSEITSEGLFYRLRHSEAFLEKVLGHLVGLSSGSPKGYRLLIVDATVVCGPGTSHTDFRFHVGYDPESGLPCTFQVTDRFVGERLALHDIPSGTLVLGDRAYGTAANMAEAADKSADFLLRVTSGNLRLYAPGVRSVTRRLSWKEMENQVPEAGATTWWVDVPVLGKQKSGGNFSLKGVLRWVRVRLVGARNLEGKVIWLATNLTEDQLPDAQACQMYRLRWQVELYFKRLKSIGDLDLQGSRDGPTARAGLLAKLILLVLTGLLQNEQAFSPYGYPVKAA